MKKTFIIFCIFCLSFILSLFLANGKTFAQLGGVLVFPNIIELDFSKNNSKKFISKIIKVENPTDKPVRIRAYVENWEMNEYGGVSFTKDPTERSICDYVKFNPKEFELQPRQNQIVRVTAKLPEGVDGEFRGMIFFETVTTKEELLKPDKEKINVAIRFVTRFGVVVYAYKGNVNRTLNFDNFVYNKQDNTDYLVASFSNDGNIHTVIDTELSFVNEGSPEKEYGIAKSRKAVLPAKPLNIQIPIKKYKLDAGNYIANIKVTYKDINEKVQVLEAETKFNYEPSEDEVKNVLVKPLTDENIEKTPENIAKPIPLDLESEVEINDL